MFGCLCAGQSSIPGIWGHHMCCDKLGLSVVEGVSNQGGTWAICVLA